MNGTPPDTDNRWSTRSVAIVGLLLTLLVIDGVDIQLLSLLAPMILTDWQADRAAFGIPMAAALLGMALGASAGGWLGDRLGLRRVTGAAALLFGLATLLVAWSADTTQLTVLRFIGGLGFGAAGPTAITLAVQFVPPPARAGVAGGFTIATPLGGLIGAAGTLALMPVVGWRGCFAICGAVSIVLGLAIVRLVPAGAVVRTGRDAPRHRDPDGAILSATNRRFTLSLWLLFLCVQFVAYAFVSWAPAYLTGAGSPLATALGATSAFNVMALTAAVSIGPALLRFGSRPLLLGGCLAASAGAVLLLFTMRTAATAHPPAALLWLSGGALGGGTGLAIGTIYALCIQAYAADRRATGLGAALMVGRIGGFAAAATGGASVASSVGGQSLYPLILIGIAAIALGASLVIQRHVAARRRPSEG